MSDDDIYPGPERRLAILRLIRDGGGRANERSLYTAVVQVGYPLTTRDDISADLNLLAERGCVVNEVFRGQFIVAVLTRIGRDVADGKAAVVGVKKGDVGD